MDFFLFLLYIDDELMATTFAYGQNVRLATREQRGYINILRKVLKSFNIL